MDLSDPTVRISVDAVGGPESESGKEMYRLLMERIELDRKAKAPENDLPLPKPEEKKKEDDILGPALEDIFQHVFRPPVSAATQREESPAIDGESARVEPGAD